jgi:glycosyltransferase involved in cell wall biosynthesis
MLTRFLRQEALGPAGCADVDNSVDNRPSAGIVWVFEGREHTLCAFHRLAYPKLWRSWILVRVRGQAAVVRDTFLNRWTYGRGADVVVCVADVVRARIPFAKSLPAVAVFPFCSRFARESSPAPALEGSPEEPLAFLDETPPIDPRLPLFLVVGRFDPVKGHLALLQAFGEFARRLPVPSSTGTPEQLRATLPVQLVFVGRSENVLAQSLVERTVEAWKGTVVTHGTRAFVEGCEGRARLFVFDERVEDVHRLMRISHFGIVPSLGSEVICRVAVEFLQSGTPLLSSTAGALAEIIPEEVGVFFSPGDDVDFRRALAEAYECVLATSVHSRMRADARDIGRRTYSEENYSRLVEIVGELSRATREPWRLS